MRWAVISGVALALAAVWWLWFRSSGEEQQQLNHRPQTSSRGIAGGAPGSNDPKLEPGRIEPPRDGTSGPVGLATTATSKMLVRGGVIQEDGTSAGAGIVVECFAGEHPAARGSTTTASDGTFSLEADLGIDAAWVARRALGVAAVDPRVGRVSYPVFVSDAASSSGGPRVVEGVRLRLRGARQIAGRTVAASGGPVEGAEVFLRWLASSGTVLSAGEHGGASPRHWRLVSGSEGAFTCWVPSGDVHATARRPGGAYGPVRTVAVTAGREPASMLELQVGDEACELVLRVVDRRGRSLHDALACPPRSHMAHVLDSSHPGDPDDGAVRADPSGVIRFRALPRGDAGFSVGVAAPGFVPRRFTVPRLRGEVEDHTVELAEKPQFQAAVVFAPGARVVPIDWACIPTTGDDRFDDIPEGDVLRLVREVVDPIELRTGSDGRTCHVFLPGPGEFRLDIRVSEFFSFTQAVSVPSGQTLLPDLSIPAPTGRYVRLAYVDSPPAGVMAYVPNLELIGETRVADARWQHGSELRRFWAPRSENRTLELWLPHDVRELSIHGRNQVDLPVQMSRVRLEQDEAEETRVKPDWGPSGTLRCVVTPRAHETPLGIEVECLVITGKRQRGESARTARTDSGGHALIPVPAGRYAVSRSRRYGAPQWQYVDVVSGQETIVEIGL